MTITRRRFMQGSGLTLAGGMAAGLFGNPLVRRAMADSGGDRYVVVLFLDGGNDGLNTVTPITDGTANLRTDYLGFRNNLALSDTALLSLGADANTGAQVGLHPALAGLKSLYDAGKVAVLQGCGYPDYSLSHEESRIIWETGTPIEPGYSGGWFGRTMIECGFGATDIPAVTVDDRVAGEFLQTQTSVLGIRELEEFGFPYDEEYPGDQTAKRTAFDALQLSAAGSAQSETAFIGGNAGATLLASEAYPPLHSDYTAMRAAFDSSYPGNSVGRDLREVAKIIYGVEQGAPGVNARFFQVNNGGYDTHADQGAGEPGGRHSQLHAEVGDALAAFYADLDDMGALDKTCILIWSEFSRRIQQNSNGTDHGSQGPMFVIGGRVQGGLYDNHPNLAPGSLNGDGNTPYSQNPGDGFRSRDFRDVYGTILKQWLGVSEAAILADILPPDVGGGGLDPNTYWTSGNHDFDLPFFKPGGAA